MKTFILLLSLSQVALAAPEVILSPLKHLYIPKGFDSNDSAEVVITGTFPNPCHARNNVNVSVKDDVIDVTITALAPDAATKALRACPDMTVPFKEVVSLGNLQGGSYKIVANRAAGAGAVSETIFIGEARSSAVDNYVYDSVDWVEQKPDGEVILHAMRYSPCYELDKVRVISNERDTLSILPIMKQVSDFCPMKGTPVSYPIKLDFTGIDVKNALLHVRTIDGKSVNAIVNSKE